MTDIIAVSSSKGGVGKTTTSFSLAAAAATRGSVIVVDLDPSISLTTQMRVPITRLNIEDVLSQKCTVEDALYQTAEAILMIPGSRRGHRIILDEACLEANFR